MSKKVELLKDIVATISVIVKLGVEGEVLDTQTNLIAFLSEAGFTTTSGKPLTQMNFRYMFGSCTHDEIREILSEFSAQHAYDLIASMTHQRTNDASASLAG